MAQNVISSDRIPFAEAISDKLLFRDKFATLSMPQQALLKVFYGQPLNAAELEIWSASQGGALFDDLGEIVGVREIVPYQPREYHHATLVVGRRGSKTANFASFVMAYEALLGGHEAHVGRLQSPLFLQVAQDLATAQANLRQFILEWLESSPVGKRSIAVIEDERHKGRKQQAITATTIKLKNRALIMVGAPTIKLRSQAVAVCNMDELAVWAKDVDAANPDFEVERAVMPGMAQFPDWKMIQASTPWTEEGLLWRGHQTGTAGSRLSVDERPGWRDFLYVNLPTLAMQNPKVRREFLEAELAKDVEAFQREYLARFSKSISGFLSSVLLREAIDRGVRERAPEPSRLYVAALDPAFRRDAFTFTIVHQEVETRYRFCSEACLATFDAAPATYATGVESPRDPICGKVCGEGALTRRFNRGLVQDVVKQWKPEKGASLNPAAIMDEIAHYVRAFKLQSVTSDQYQLESLQALAVDRGFCLDNLDWTVKTKARIFVNLQQLLNQRRLRLLDNTAQLDELRTLERELTGRGVVSIHAPAARHDDLASCLALACHKATWFAAPSVAPVEPGPRSIHDELFAAYMAKRKAAQRDQVWWT